MLREAMAGHRALVLFALACLVGTVATGVQILIDTTVVKGAPAWHKPCKFFVSSGIYAFTFAWYLGQGLGPGRTSPARSRVGWWMGTGIWVALTVELALIAIQAGRGVSSHFNFTTPLDSAIFATMGVMILILTLLHAGLWVGLLRARWPDRARLAACRWGAGIALLGLAVGGLMVRPSGVQLAEAYAGRPLASGAHAVGVADGGAGLPFLNWSTEGGDRRVGHFVGLHAMQVIPAVALLVPLGWPLTASLAAVRATGMAYAALTALLTLQAEQARPLLRPGLALTLAVLLTGAGWVVAVATVHRRGSTRRH